MPERFIPSPGKLVKFLNEKGEVVMERHLNRKERRRLSHLSKKENQK